MSEEHYICGNYQNLAEPLSRKWSKNTISWFYRGGHPSVSDQQARQVFATAFGLWSEVTNLDFAMARSIQDADIVMASVSIDGSGGVLAWSEFPSGTRQVGQGYDRSDRYVVEIAPRWPSVGLLEVATHEIGHALGLDHDDRGADAVMRPTYDPGLYKPTARDVARVQQLYGARRPAPTPPPNPPNPAPKPNDPRVFTVLQTLDQFGDVMAAYEIARRIA